MADFDKDSIMNLLGGLLGDDKKEDISGVIDAVTDSMPKNTNTNTNTGNDSLFDTAAVMSQITNIMGKVNNAKSSREYSLLTAIRPYIRDSRQPKLDSCMKILQAVSIIGEFKGKK